jgi:small subunit ribosomal protein S6
MERQLGLHEDVLRSLTVSIDEIDMEPSAILQSRGSRDDRPRRSDRDDRDDTVTASEGEE